MSETPQIFQMQNLIFPLLAITIFAIFHFIIYKGLLKSLSSKKPIRRALLIFTWINFLGVAGYLLARSFPSIPQILYFLLSLSIGVAFCLFVVTFFYHLFALIIMLLPKERRKTYRNISKKIAFAIGVIFILLGTYGGISKPTIKHTKIEMPSLSAPLKTILLSDIHAGGLMDRNHIEYIVSLSNSQDPDIVFLVGDIIDAPFDSMTEVWSALSKLKAKNGIYFVLGNHEYLHDADRILEQMRKLGFITLNNNTSVISGLINIAGINDIMGNRMGYLLPNVNLSLAHSNPNLPTILLSHQPKIVEYLDQEPKMSQKNAIGLNTFNKIDLILSGHTHGGQIFPFSLAVLLQQPHLYGLFEYDRIDGSKTMLYISQGAGFWGPPMRLGSSAEVSMIELLPSSKETQ